MPRVRDIANPAHKAGGWFLPHLLTILIVAGVALLAFGAGWFGGQTYEQNFDRHYYATHYDAPMPIIHEMILRPSVTAPQTFPIAAAVRVSYVPAAGDQWNQGTCAAWSDAWVLSYLYRLQHPGSWVRFSPRCEYDHYSLTYANGQDIGSWPPQNAELIPTQGIASFKQVPYPPYVIDSTYPALCNNTTYRFPVEHRILGSGENEGQAAVDAIKQQIALGRPVLLTVPVYPELDSGVVQPLIVSPKPGEQSRGGHEVFGIAYNDTKVFPDGTRGGVRFQNSWGKDYGVNGRAWFSYDFIRRYVSAVMVALIGNDATPPQAGKPLGPATTAPPVPAPPLPPATKTGKGRWYVHGVITKDTHKNISGIINRTGDKYGVWPLALAAVAGVESGVNQYAPRYGTGCDVSFGLVQITVCTATQFGVGDGTLSAANIARVRAAENNPAIAIDLAARYIHGALAYRGYQIHFPLAYGLYNCGWAVNYSLLVTPGNDCYLHVQAYNGWFRYANQAWAGA